MNRLSAAAVRCVRSSCSRICSRASKRCAPLSRAVSLAGGKASRSTAASSPASILFRWVSQSVQEMDEVGIPGFVAEPEQSLRNPSAVFSGGRGDLLAQLSFEPFYRVALAIILESQIGADADVFGQEEPGAGLLGRARGLEPSAEGAEAVDAVLVGETQLKPHIAHMVSGFAPVAHEPPTVVRSRPEASIVRVSPSSRNGSSTSRALDLPAPFFPAK